MNVPQDRKYLETHEWLLVDKQRATVGITQLAADQLSDITFVDLPAIGTVVKAGEPFGEIESVKATSELFSGLSGTIVATNGQLVDEPELVNSDPFRNGWMIKIDLSDLGEVEALWNAQQYEEKYKE